MAGCEEKEKPSGGSEGGETQSEGSEGEQQQEQQAIYTGFMKVNEGQWAEYKFNINGMTSSQRMECIGIENVDGKECIGFETDFEMNGMKTIMKNVKFKNIFV